MTRRWDEFLVEEHELIERVMAVLEAELNNVAVGQIHHRRLGRAIDFLLEFGDRLHNLKEEKHLFPLMEKRGVPSFGPIAVMLAEHQQERELLTRLQTELPTLRETPGAPARFVNEARAYLQVRHEHIWKENDVLYPMGRRVFQEGDNEALLVAFDEIDQSTYGPDAKQKYLNMVVEAEAEEGKPLLLIDNLNRAQLHGILETLPVELTFVDVDNTVVYFNRLDKKKIFPRTRSVVGRRVERCHPAHSLDRVMEIINGFRAGTLDKAEFWIDFKGEKVLIRYFPVRDENGQYLGTLEVTQEITEIQKLQGEKRLLHE